MATIRGGDKLAAKLHELSKKVARGGAVKVGFLEGATDSEGTSIPLIAATQNFGAPTRGIPPRPFFSNMVRDKSPAWGAQMGAALNATDFDGEAALGLMGEGIAGQLRQAIIDTVRPPLSPVTLMLRKMRSEDQTLRVTGATVGEAARRVAAGESTAGVSIKPLVDRGEMLAAVDYEVTP